MKEEAEGGGEAAQPHVLIDCVESSIRGTSQEKSSARRSSSVAPRVPPSVRCLLTPASERRCLRSLPMTSAVKRARSTSSEASVFLSTTLRALVRHTPLVDVDSHAAMVALPFVYQQAGWLTCVLLIR